MDTAKRLRRTAKGWPPQAAYPGNEGRPPFNPERVVPVPRHSSGSCATPCGVGGHAQGTRYQGWFRLTASPTLRYVTLPLRGIGKDKAGSQANFTLLKGLVPRWQTLGTSP